MRRHGRIVRWGKWAATVCAVAMFVVWAGSARWKFQVGPIQHSVYLAVYRGVFIHVRMDFPLPNLMEPLHIELDKQSEGIPYKWWPIFGTNKAWPARVDQVALWPAVLTLSGLAAWLWFIHRRYPPGRCRACGYDLTLNESGVCPECGAKLVPQEAVG